jgi:prolipoprotein diacylglyceryl transferase
MSEALIPSPPFSYLNLGLFNLHMYAICILAGVACATVLTGKRWAKRKGDFQQIIDLLFIVVVFGIIGARLYHVIFTDPESYFGPTGNWVDIFALWKGGLGIFGAVTFGVLSAFVYCRIKKLDFFSLLDAAAPGVLLAQGIGRLGNWFNQELFGKPTTLPWGLQISDIKTIAVKCPNDFPCAPGTLFHPTFLYELIWDVLGCLLLLFLSKRFADIFTNGKLFYTYIAYYCVGRFIMELFRIDTAPIILGLRIHAWVAILVFMLAVVLFFGVQKHIFSLFKTRKEERKH